MADNRDLFPQDNPLLSELINAINQLNASLQEQRSYLSELNRNLTGLGSQIRNIPQRFNEAFDRFYQRAPIYAATQPSGVFQPDIQAAEMAREINRTFSVRAAEYLGQAAGLGAEAAGVGGMFNEQIAELFGEASGRIAGRELGAEVRSGINRGFRETLGSALLQQMSPMQNPMFAQFMLPELARQMDLQSLAFARGTMTLTGAASQGLMMAVGFPLQFALFSPLMEPMQQISAGIDAVRQQLYGFMPLGTAAMGIMQILQTPPLMRYEEIYQSQLLLASSLGGLPQAVNVMNMALEKAREFPLQFGDILQAFRSLSVYPTVKPVLGDAEFQEKLLNVVSGLALINPQQGLGGALFAIVEALSGSQRSLQMRFNISSDIVAELAQMSKAEMSADPVALIEGLNRFIERSVGTGVLEKARYTFTKQLENFEDALTLATKAVFENARIYPAITQAALAFQTSFAAISQTPAATAFFRQLLSPVVNSLEEAVARFVGLSPGQLRTMPMGQLEEYIESFFERMSPEEYSQRLQRFGQDLLNVFGLFREQAQVILTPIREFAYSMFSDIGKIGAEILGESAVGVLRGLISDPGALLSFAGTFGAALIPVGLGFRIASGLFDRFARFRVRQEAISNAIAARQIQAGLRPDPIEDLQRSINKATTTIDRIIQNQTSLAATTPAYIPAMPFRQTIPTRPIPPAPPGAIPTGAPVAPAAGAAPVDTLGRRLIDAINAPFERTVNRLEQGIRILGETGRLERDIRLANALQNFATAGLYRDSLISATLQGILDRNRFATSTVERLVNIGMNQQLRSQFQSALLQTGERFANALRQRGIEVRNFSAETMGRIVGQFIVDNIGRYGVVGSAQLASAVLERILNRYPGDEAQANTVQRMIRALESDDMNERRRAQEQFRRQFGTEFRTLVRDIRNAFRAGGFVPSISLREQIGLFSVLSQELGERGALQYIQNVSREIAQATRGLGRVLGENLRSIQNQLQTDMIRARANASALAQNLAPGLGIALTSGIERINRGYLEQIRRIDTDDFEKVSENLTNISQRYAQSVNLLSGALNNISNYVRELEKSGEISKEESRRIRATTRYLTRIATDLEAAGDIEGAQRIYRTLTQFPEIAPQQIIRAREIARQRVYEDLGRFDSVRFAQEVGNALQRIQRLETTPGFIPALRFIGGEEAIRRYEAGTLRFQRAAEFAASTIGRFQQAYIMGGGMFGLLERFMMGNFAVMLASSLPVIGEPLRQLSFTQQALLGGAVGLASMILSPQMLANAVNTGMTAALSRLGGIPIIGRFAQAQGAAPGLSRLGMFAGLTLGISGIVSGTAMAFSSSEAEVELNEALMEASRLNIVAQNLDISGITAITGSRLASERRQRAIGAGLLQGGAGLAALGASLLFVPGVGQGAAAAIGITGLIAGGLGIGLLSDVNEAPFQGVINQIRNVSALAEQLSTLNQQIERAEMNPLVSPGVLNQLYRRRRELRQQIRIQAAIANEMNRIVDDDLDDVLENIIESATVGERRAQRDAEQAGIAYAAAIKTILSFEPEEIQDELKNKVDSDVIRRMSIPMEGADIDTFEGITRTYGAALARMFREVFSNMRELPRALAIETLRNTQALIDRIKPEEFVDIFGKEGIRDLIAGANEAAIKGILLNDKDLIEAADMLKDSIRRQVIANPEEIAKRFGLEEFAKEPAKLQEEISKRVEEGIAVRPQEIFTPEQFRRAESNVFRTLVNLESLLGEGAPTQVIGGIEYVVSPSGRLIDRQLAQKYLQQVREFQEALINNQPITQEQIQQYQEAINFLRQAGFFASTDQFIASVVRNIKELSTIGIYQPEFAEQQFTRMYSQLEAQRRAATAELQRIDSQIAEVTQQLRETPPDDTERRAELLSKLNSLKTQRDSIIKDLANLDYIEDQLADAERDIAVQRFIAPVQDYTQEIKRFQLATQRVLFEEAPLVFQEQATGFSPLRLARFAPAQFAPLFRDYAETALQQIFSADIPDWLKLKLAQQYLPFASPQSMRTFNALLRSTLQEGIQGQIFNPEEWLYRYGAYEDLAYRQPRVRVPGETPEEFQKRREEVVFPAATEPQPQIQRRPEQPPVSEQPQQAQQPQQPEVKTQELPPKPPGGIPAPEFDAAIAEKQAQTPQQPAQSISQLAQAAQQAASNLNQISASLQQVSNAGRTLSSVFVQLASGAQAAVSALLQLTQQPQTEQTQVRQQEGADNLLQQSEAITRTILETPLTSTFEEALSPSLSFPISTLTYPIESEEIPVRELRTVRDLVEYTEQLQSRLTGAQPQPQREQEEESTIARQIDLPLPQPILVPDLSIFEPEGASQPQREQIAPPAPEEQITEQPRLDIAGTLSSVCQLIENNIEAIRECLPNLQLSSTEIAPNIGELTIQSSTVVETQPQQQTTQTTATPQTAEEGAAVVSAISNEKVDFEIILSP